jgi:hypothetical protein
LDLPRWRAFDWFLVVEVQNDWWVAPSFSFRYDEVGIFHLLISFLSRLSQDLTPTIFFIKPDEQSCQERWQWPLEEPLILWTLCNSVSSRTAPRFDWTAQPTGYSSMGNACSRGNGRSTLTSSSVPLAIRGRRSTAGDADVSASVVESFTETVDELLYENKTSSSNKIDRSMSRLSLLSDQWATDLRLSLQFECHSFSTCLHYNVQICIIQNLSTGLMMVVQSEFKLNDWIREFCVQCDSKWYSFVSKFAQQNLPLRQYWRSPHRIFTLCFQTTNCISTRNTYPTDVRVKIDLLPGMPLKCEKQVPVAIASCKRNEQKLNESAIWNCDI